MVIPGGRRTSDRFADFSTMIRSALRELVRLLATMFAVSVVAFLVFDSTGEHDWWGTLHPARSFAMPREEALIQGVPRLFVANVRDATVLTIEDVNQLGVPARRQGARDRLTSRGSVIIPTILPRIANLSPSQRAEVFVILGALGSQLSAAAAPGREDSGAGTKWAVRRQDRPRRHGSAFDHGASHAGALAEPP